MVSSAPTAVAVADDTVTFAIDGVQPRIVHLGAEHPAGIEPTLLGHSIGRWDGNVFVVDSMGFGAHPEGMGFLFPSSQAKRTVERFRLSDDRKHLEYEITVEDSAYLTGPVTYRTTWDYRPDQVPSNAACDPATAPRFLDD